MLLINPGLFNQGPVVQSIVSLTSSLRGQLIVLQLYNQIHWNFLLKKWEKLLHCKSFSHFFDKKYWQISDINAWNFNETLTNDVVSFEQPGPGLPKHLDMFKWSIETFLPKCQRSVVCGLPFVLIRSNAVSGVFQTDHIFNPKHSEQPKLYRVLAVLSAIGLTML